MNPGATVKRVVAKDMYPPQSVNFNMKTKMKNEIDSLRYEIWRKEKEARAKVKTPTFDELFAHTPEGDFHWEGDPEDVGNVWWGDKGPRQDCQYIDMGRENGKTWFVVYLETIAGSNDYQLEAGWDEREGNEITDDVLSDLRFHLEFRTIRHFASWAKYNLDCAISGEDPLENWFDSSKNTPENNIAAAKDNLKYLTK
jgi:hypothetical protein